jgi:transcription antitermination factor NusG
MKVGAAATEAKMLPGRVVIFDDDDISVKEAGAVADNFLGVLDVNADRLESEHFEVGDQVKVITGPVGIGGEVDFAC